MARDTRLQKAMSLWGVCSRRHAEEYIRKGRVKVNGHPASLGDKIDTARDLVTLDGERVGGLRVEQRYIMLHKPRGFVTTMKDEFDRRCVAQLLAGEDQRLFPIGRLDKNSEGLLLCTNDGEFANLMMHPSKKVSKTYRVTVRPEPSDEQLAKLAEGIYLDGRKTAPAIVRVLDKSPGRCVLEFVIREGRNRQIRRMCESLELEVARLKRTAYGPVKLGMLGPAKYRDLTKQEVAALRNAAGLAQERGEER
ncbi:pseudouridine synthase [Neobittarella massiliensis]|uniref:pseudouridine synthase n=1 Tax=Neobittarella massiliensis (ex Bilen et al. 2018) TaxID=2041842 RepID=UPI000CF6AEDA|nr:pseudouridine synthase [Neobittarella massiliensis]